MIGSLRALVVLAVLTIVMIIGAIVWVPEPPAPVASIDRRIAPGIDVDSIHALSWERAGRVEAEIDKHDGRWGWGTGLPADPGAVDEVLAALRAGVWQRREPVARAGTVHARLLATASTTMITLGIGDTVAGTEQVWVVAGDHALLVDGWIAHALDRAPVSLRVRQPLARVAEVDTIALTYPFPKSHPGVTLAGHPRKRDGVLVAAGLVHALELALAELTLVDDSVGSSPPHMAAEPNGSIHLGAPIAVTIGQGGTGSCGSWIAGLDGCVTREAWHTVGEARDALDKPIAEIAERRPAPIDAVTIKLPDGVLDLAKRPSIDGHDADPARVAELVAALVAPADVTAVPATKPTATITIRDKAGTTIELELHDGIVVRHGEPLGLRVAPAAWAALTRLAPSYRDTALWLEEPTAIIAIIVDGVTYKSGNVVGTWSRDPAGTLDPAALDDAARILAAPRAPAATLPAGFTTRHRISIMVAAPSGPAVTHVLEIGTGCVAKADGNGVTLPATLCALASLGT